MPDPLLPVPPTPMHPNPPTAPEPDDLPNKPLRAKDVAALVAKRIG